MKITGLWLGTLAFVVMTSLPLVVPEEADPNGMELLQVYDDTDYQAVWSEKDKAWKQHADIDANDSFSIIIGSYDVDLEFEPLPVDPNHPYARPYRLTDDSIRALAKSGQICRVMGHQWKMNWKDFSVDVGEHTTGTSSRTCTLCGIKQTQHYIEAHWSEWE